MTVGAWLRAVLLPTVAILSAADAFAVPDEWTAGSGDWSMASNWSLSLPGSNVTTYIANGGTASITHPAAACSYLYLGSGSGSGSGTVQLGAGGGLVASFSELIGNTGSGSFMQSGGFNVVPQQSIGILSLGNDPGVLGTYNLTGGSVSAPITYVGDDGPGSFVQSGGTHSVSSELKIAAEGGNGTYSLSGSGLLTAPLESIAGDDGGSETGSFTQSGGTNLVNSLILADYSTAVGTYSLKGGLLAIGSGGLNQYSGSGEFNFSGGTLQAGSSFSTTVPIVLGLAGSPGNVVFDVGSNTLTLAGRVSGTGQLTKSGNGQLILSGPVTFHGGMTIAEGVAIVDSSADLPDGASLTIGAGATHIFNGMQEFRAASEIHAVPEPSAVILLGLGALGISAFGSLQWHLRLAPKQRPEQSPPTVVVCEK
jgi:fibronectin-binding autotransporter adhesin